MPARKVCQNFFRNALAPFHSYRQQAIIDATAALMQGASLTLSSIGRHLSGQSQVKNKIKRVDRLLGNRALHSDIPQIFSNITSMITARLSWCVIAVDWSGYPSQDWHVLRASLLCDGRSVPLLSWVVPSSKQNNTLIQKDFLDALHHAVNPQANVIIVSDAGFQSAWFRHIKSLGWDFVGRIRGTVQFCLHHDKDNWLKTNNVQGKSVPEYLGPGTLARTTNVQCDGHFYLHKKPSAGRKNKRSKGRPSTPRTEKEKRVSAREPWLIFASMEEFKPKQIMKLYSRRMQIEQNFRDEKSERFGFGLRASRTKDGNRFLVLSLLATLATIVLWLLGYHCENKGLHLRYQANSTKDRRIISFLTLAKNVLQHSPRILRRINLDDVLTKLASTYRSMVLVY